MNFSLPFSYPSSSSCSSENSNINTINSHPLEITKKFIYLNENENKNKLNNKNNSRVIEKKISIEVILTEDKIKELMKCKPTEEWISKTGKSLKYCYPELSKAHLKDIENEQEIIRKSKVFLSLSLLYFSFILYLLIVYMFRFLL